MASPLDFALAATPRALVLQCPPVLQREPAHKLRWMCRADLRQFRSDADKLLCIQDRKFSTGPPSFLYSPLWSELFNPEYNTPA